jgi:hypothetical protein
MTAALYALTGAVAVPPRFGMGFVATYWGYSNMSQVPWTVGGVLLLLLSY